jgi:hypothetical protein
MHPFFKENLMRIHLRVSNNHPGLANIAGGEGFSFDGLVFEYSFLN